LVIPVLELVTVPGFVDVLGFLQGVQGFNDERVTVILGEHVPVGREA